MTQVIKFEMKDKRYGKGEFIAKNRYVYKITNMDLWFVESESQSDVYYTVIFENNELVRCSCNDNSKGHNFCKHFYASIIADVENRVKEVYSLPNAKEIIH